MFIYENMTGTRGDIDRSTVNEWVKLVLLTETLLIFCE